MQDNLRQRIVQDVITIVVKSDKNNDQSIDRVEAKVLALRIRLALQEYGVEFDAEKFLMAIRKDPSLTGVMAIVQKLLANDDASPDLDRDDDDDDLFDMFYIASDEEDSRRSLFRTPSVAKSLGKQVSELTLDKTEPIGRMSRCSGRSRRTSIMLCDMDEIIRMSEKCSARKGNF